MQAEVLSPQDVSLEKFLKMQGYYNIRFLEGGVICNAHFIFTDAVLIDVNFSSYERRICYPRGIGIAEQMCLSMQSLDDPPLPGYTAIK